MDDIYVRGIFLRGLGVIYLIAFVSFWTQLRGLIGSRGILPARNYLAQLRHLPAWQRWRYIPSLFWLSASDRALDAACLVGTLASLAVILSFATVPALVVLWALYLSLVAAGEEFLAFQWDSLLLETGFLAIFYAVGPGVPAIPRLLFHWLFFRLLFESGIVKLTSGDDCWRDLSALDYHYQTQPLPTRLAWYLHHSPRVLRRVSVFLTYVLEIGLPFLAFGPARAREIAFVGNLVLMLAIGLSGNYGFFNWLTILIGVPLLGSVSGVPSALPDAVGWALAALTACVTIPQLVAAISPSLELPGWVNAAARATAPFRSMNGYGLFRVMTRQRPEIRVEGSDDQQTWTPYRFHWKPNDEDDAPRFVAPHQPRLDWQMWFAAISNYRANPWIENFLARLLEGGPEVGKLLAERPFGERPPKYVRALIYDYAFTTKAERRETGRWWKKKLLGLYCPVLTLKG